MQKWLVEGWRLWKNYRPRVHQWLKSLRVRHVNLFFAVVFSLMVAAVIATVAARLLTPLLNVGTQTTPPADLTRLALTIAAGVGGVVALVVAYRRQRDLEQGRFVEAFGAAAKQLGDTDVAVRLAGVYAMAGVADQASKLKRQQCIDVLCGYLRLPYSPELGNNHQSALLIRKPPLQEGDPEQEIQFQYRQNDKVVRQTIVRVIVAHLQKKAPQSWSSNDFDFTGSHFEGANFFGATFSGGNTRFDGASFSGKPTFFSGVTFSGEFLSFTGATFSSSIWFNGSTFSGENTYFSSATFSGTRSDFTGVSFSGNVHFNEAIFSGELTYFNEAIFSGELTYFGHATFNGKHTSFEAATFKSKGTWFKYVDFGVGKVTFARPKVWSPAPVFDWDGDSDAVSLRPANVEPRNWPPFR